MYICATVCECEERGRTVEQRGDSSSLCLSVFCQTPEMLFEGAALTLSSSGGGELFTFARGLQSTVLVAAAHSHWGEPYSKDKWLTALNNAYRISDCPWMSQKKLNLIKWKVQKACKTLEEGKKEYECSVFIFVCVEQRISSSSQNPFGIHFLKPVAERAQNQDHEYIYFVI